MKYALFFIALLSVAGPASADTNTLTWTDCIDIAIKNNPDLQSAQFGSASSQANYRGSFNNVLPRLNLSSSYNTSQNSDGSSRWQAGGSANLDLINTARWANISAASAGLKQANANLALVSVQLLFNLRQAFANLLFAQQDIDVSKRILDIRAQNAEMVRLRYDSGRESKGNMMRADAEKVEAAADLSQANRELRASQQELNRQLGRDVFTVVAATGTLGANATTIKENELPSLAQGHPRIRLAQAAVKVAEANLKEARSAYWPVLSANYSRSYVGPSYFPQDRNWTAAGVLSLPIFGGGPTDAYYSSLAGRRNLDAVQQDLRSTQNQVLADLENAWSGFEGAWEQTRVQSALLAASRQRNEEGDIRYASGLLTYDNWELIVSDRVTSERGFVRSQQNADLAQAGLDQALGKGLGE